ncbi:uncharacterized protein [Malus domestica]|uniref:uncharacterized protein n=1 Tax=Malus domestica TaxID=3750 RepID=UPI003976051A
MGDSKSVEASNDPSSPFYNHYSDNPGMHLVSTLLTGNNYSTWSRSMCIALSAKNKFGFVDGSVKKPSDKKRTEATLWKHCNDMVLMWILNSVSSGLSNSVVYAETLQQLFAMMAGSLPSKAQTNAITGPGDEKDDWMG